MWLGAELIRVPAKGYVYSETSLPLAYRDFIATVDGKDIVGVTDASGIAPVTAPFELLAISIMFYSGRRHAHWLN